MKDMTKGVPSKVLFSFAFPMMLSGMFQQFYNIADSLIAGKFSGTSALAAIGASYPITMLFIAIATGSGVGCSVIISKYFGAKDYKALKTTISTAIISTVVLSILFTIIGTLICNPLMRLMNTPEEIFAQGALYLRIYIWGLLFLFVYNITNAIFNGLGDSKTPLYFLIFSSLFNIALDYIFVKYFHMGVAGVAWATFIAQGLSSILALAFLIKRTRQLKIGETCPYFSFSILKSIGYIAIPSILQQSIVSIGQLLIQSLVNSYGTSVIAGYSAAIKIDSFFKIVIISMGNAMSNFTAQNVGASKPLRIKKGYRAATLTMAVYCAIAFGIILLFSPYLISCFINNETAPSLIKEMINIGSQYMHIVVGGYFVCALLLINNGVLRGHSNMIGFTSATLSDLFVRVGASYLLAHLFGYHAIWISIPIGWLVGYLISLFFMKRNKENYSISNT